MTRRELLSQALLACLAPVFAGAPHDRGESKLRSRLAELDRHSGGRLGCAVLNVDSGQVIEHRGRERFPMCSTFKPSAIAYILQRVEQGIDRLDRGVHISQGDILEYAPITKLHVGESMSLAELCSGAITVSDNTAANLLLAGFGGPGALTRFWRSIGDPETRLDRNEPSLNEATPGDHRDTTTPVAMAKNLRKFLFGELLAASSQDLLTKWLIASTTGGARLRAGLPREWSVGDKTGSGSHGTTNDIAVIRHPEGQRCIVTAYLTQCTLPDDERNGILADVGRAVTSFLTPCGPSREHPGPV